MSNGAMAHFTVVNRAVAHCFNKVGHPGPIACHAEVWINICSNLIGCLPNLGLSFDGLLITVITRLPMGLATQKECIHALSLISPPTLNVSLHNLLITPFSHHPLLHTNTHSPPLFICTPPSFHKKHPFYTVTFHQAQK